MILFSSILWLSVNWPALINDCFNYYVNNKKTSRPKRKKNKSKTSIASKSTSTYIGIGVGIGIRSRKHYDSLQSA